MNKKKPPLYKKGNIPFIQSIGRFFLKIAVDFIVRFFENLYWIYQSIIWNNCELWRLTEGQKVEVLVRYATTGMVC